VHHNDRIDRGHLEVWIRGLLARSSRSPYRLGGKFLYIYGTSCQFSLFPAWQNDSNIVNIYLSERINIDN